MFTAIKHATGLLAVLVVISGCAPFGLIYTNTVSPSSIKFNETPIGTKRCEINGYQIKEPASGLNIYAEWTTGYILSEARKAGITDIYYMDKRTLSILNGTFKRESLIIYGD